MSERTSLELDRERVTCLLLINTQLMKKAINIYSNLLTNPQILSQIPPQNKQSIMELYQNCTRRIHCNLSVLTFINERYHSDGSAQNAQRPQFPVILSAPPDMPELNQLYTKLQELYPEALQFLKMKIQQMKKQQQPVQQPLQQAPQQQMTQQQQQQFRRQPLGQPTPQMVVMNSPVPAQGNGLASSGSGDFNNGNNSNPGFNQNTMFDPNMIMQQQQQHQQQQQQPHQQQQPQQQQQPHQQHPQQFIPPNQSNISPQLIFQMNQNSNNVMMDFY